MILLPQSNFLKATATFTFSNSHHLMTFLNLLPSCSTEMAFVSVTDAVPVHIVDELTLLSLPAEFVTMGFSLLPGFPCQIAPSRLLHELSFLSLCLRQ